MEALEGEKRRQLSVFVVGAVNKRIPVVVSGHVSDNFDEQLKDFDDALNSGCDGIVLVSNRFGQRENQNNFMVL